MKRRDFNMTRERTILLKKLEKLNQYEQNVLEEIQEERNALKKRLKDLDYIEGRHFVPSHVTINRTSHKKMEAYYEATQLLKNNPEKVFLAKEITAHVEQETGYKISQFAYFYKKLQEIDPNITRIRRGCYGYKSEKSTW